MQLKAEISHVIYAQPTSDEGRAWYVLKTDMGKASGEMLWCPCSGERVVLDGEWAAYKAQKQFKFKAAMLDIPSDPQDQLRYVCAEAEGIGPAIELAIWEEWGADWWTLAEADVVPRLKGAAFLALRRAMNNFQLKREEANAVSWLLGKSASMGMAKGAWDKWKGGMQGTVTDDCYRLADLKHYGFADVDREIRREFGIGDSDPRRIRAAIVYAMKRLTEWGATLVGWQMLSAEVATLLAGAGNAEMIAAEAKTLIGEGTLHPFADVQGLALTADYNAEQAILEYIG